MPRAAAQLDLAALADAFARDGLHGATAIGLARAAGVAKPTLYAHGVSKEALLLRAVEAEVERLVGRLAAAERLASRRGAKDLAVAYALAVLDHGAARPLGLRLLTLGAPERSAVAGPVALAVGRLEDRVVVGLRRALAAEGSEPGEALWLARALLGAALALAQVRTGERRPARAVLAARAARVVAPPAARPAASWPVA